MGDEFPDGDGPLPPNLAFLRRLVTVLTAVMIMGVITIVALLVIRLGSERQAVVTVPNDFALPQGVATVGYALHGDAAIIVGDDGVIRVFDATTGELRQDFTLD